MTKSAVVDGVIADRLSLHVASFDKHADGHDPVSSLQILKLVMNDAIECAADICERAARETKLTQKQLAEALGTSPSTLRGLRART